MAQADVWMQDRQKKDIARIYATSFPPRTSALFLPADNAKCVLSAEASGMISKKKTNVVLVERDSERFKGLQKTLKKTKWDNYCEAHHTHLEKLDLKQKLDYIWIDLNGTVTSKLGFWVQDVLSKNLVPGAVICLTHEYGWRSNEWLRNANHHFTNSENTQDCERYVEFRDNHRLWIDPLYTFPPFLLACLLRNWKLNFFDPFKYRDTADMVLYQAVVMGRTTSPYFPPVPKMEHNFGEIVMKKSTKSTVEPVTCSMVVSRILAAKGPGQKAAATKLQNQYVKSRVKTGMKETQVVAAIKAAVTKARG